MSNCRKYTSAGGINPHYALDEIAEQEVQFQLDMNFWLAADAAQGECEGKLTFLKDHMNDPEEFRLAKMILGIKD